MPSINKRRARNKQKLKQKKLLKIRLVKISMVIEDYLYKFKPVSTREARAYVEEVSNYKQQCVGDVRSLQVIEKITRCMNSIIAEQQEDLVDCINFQHVSENYCPSPVYSLADDDGTMLDQSILNPNIEGAGKDNSDFETIDLCDDEDIAHKNINVEVEIHRAMSNISIKENNHTKNLNFNTMDCSQSILKDFNDIDNRAEEIKKTKAVKTHQGIVSIEQKHNLTINCNEQEFDMNCSPTTVAVSKTSTTKYGRLTEANDQVSKKISNKDVSADNKKKFINLKEKNVTFVDTTETIDPPDNNKNIQLQKNNSRQGKCKRSAKKDRIVKQKRKRTEVSETPVNIFSKNDKFTSNLLTMLPSTNETVHQKTQSTAICGLNEAYNSIYNKSMAKIYNKNVENDLSWVENIRYVREISSAEFDSKYISLTDSFWGNFALPNDWDEKDFVFFQ